jgi:hypothetical protein
VSLDKSLHCSKNPHHDCQLEGLSEKCRAA